MKQVVKTFDELVEYLVSKYRKEFLDEISGRILDVVVGVIEKSIEERVEECFRKKLELPDNSPIPEDYYYHYTNIYEECRREAEKEVMKQ